MSCPSEDQEIDLEKRIVKSFEDIIGSISFFVKNGSIPEGKPIIVENGQYRVHWEPKSGELVVFIAQVWGKVVVSDRKLISFETSRPMLHRSSDRDVDMSDCVSRLKRIESLIRVVNGHIFETRKRLDPLIDHVIVLAGDVIDSFRLIQKMEGVNEFCHIISKDSAFCQIISKDKKYWVQLSEDNECLTVVADGFWGNLYVFSPLGEKSIQLVVRNYSIDVYPHTVIVTSLPSNETINGPNVARMQIEETIGALEAVIDGILKPSCPEYF